MPADPIFRVHGSFAGNIDKAMDAPWGVFGRVKSTHPLHYFGGLGGPRDEGEGTRRGGRGPHVLGVNDDCLHVGPTRQGCGRAYRWGADMLWLAKGVTWFERHCDALRVSSREPP